MKGLPFTFRRNMAERIKLTDENVRMILATDFSEVCGWEIFPDLLRREESTSDSYWAALRIRLDEIEPELAIGEAYGVEFQFFSDIRCFIDGVDMNDILPFMSIRTYAGKIPTILPNDPAMVDRVEAFFDNYLSRPGIGDTVWGHLPYMLKVRNYLVNNARCVVVNETDLTMQVNANIPGKGGYMTVTWDFWRALDDLKATNQLGES